MIDLSDLSRGKTNLISIRAESLGGFPREFHLRKFSWKSRAQRNSRIRRTGHAESLIYPAACGKRITDCTTDTSRRASERLNFRGMIVRLILELKQPSLGSLGGRGINGLTL